MRIQILIAVSLLLMAVPGTQAAAHELPPTIYEDPEIPPQAMGAMDPETRLFTAHPGWIDGQIIHYYKFQMYVPGNYDTGNGGLDKVPIVDLYLPSTDGTFAGVPDGQRPILTEYAVKGNHDYSDFVHIVFVGVPDGYSPNEHTTAEGLLAEHDTVSPTGIIANVPVVPMDSGLEDPLSPGEAAPIEPWMAWYEGHSVQTFAFESTSQDFADYINPITRPDVAHDSGYESSVSPDMAGSDRMNAIPIWHVNQYTKGVTPGENNGGPSEMGQQNVIAKDRLDDGYSPLWQVYWATQVPLGYSADEARSAVQFGTGAAPKNGFAIAETPMFVNCPNIGPHGGQAGSGSGATGFGIESFTDGQTVELQGSLIMQPGKKVKAVLDGETLAETTSGHMGSYVFDIPADDLGAGTHTIDVVYDDADAGPHVQGATVASFDVTKSSISGGETADGNGFMPLLILLLVAAVVFAMAKYGP